MKGKVLLCYTVVFVAGIYLLNVGQAQQPPPPTAKKKFIQCPTSEVRREVTTRIPEPWWSTPIINGFYRAYVDDDRRELRCEYGRSGQIISIRRKLPRGATKCMPKGKGFDCYYP